MRLPLLPLLALASAAALVAASPEDAAPHLAAGQAALASGQYVDASRAFTEALEHDRSYVTLYKRATAYLSMGRTGAALDDFDAILALNPSLAKASPPSGRLSGAHLEKAKVQVKEGSFAAARASLQAYPKSKPDDNAAVQLLSSVDTAADALTAARTLAKRAKWDKCIDEASLVLELSPNLGEARQIRADCFFGKGDIDDGIGELTRLAMLQPSSADVSILVSTLSFFFVSPSPALPQLKQCLHYDPDSTPCKKAHRVLKGLAKGVTQIDNFLASNTWRSAVNHLVGTPSKPSVLDAFDDALKSYQPSFPAALASAEAVRTSEPRRKLYAGACKALTELGETAKAQRYCDETLRMKEDDMDGLVGKAEGLLKAEEWQEAVRLLERAFEASGRSSQDIMNRLSKAQRLLKQSKAKDYYKILGVARDADDRTIKRAYRKAAKSAHPDKGGSEEKMAALNEAYEVLSNPELRARFDNGDDPNDTSNQGGGGPGHGHGNPFAHHGGGNPFQFFQQGGFQQQHQGGFRQQEFKFHWN